MVSEIIKNLEKRYKQGKDLKIGQDVFTPCLKECKVYRRCTGTFGSSAFKNYLGALGDIVKDGTVIEILTSMNGIAKDSTLYSALKGTKDEEGRNFVLQNYCDDIGLIVAGCKTTAATSNRDYFQKLIAYLIANNQLIIKFALPLNDELTSDDFWNEDDIKERAMYHFKYGYFVFHDDSIIAFEGSVNETDTALYRSGEMVTLHKSWIEEQKDDVEQIKGYVDEDFGKRNDSFRIYDISDKTLELIKKYAGDKRPVNPNPSPIPAPKPPPIPPKSEDIPYPLPGTDAWKWRHQIDALKKFIQLKSGVLEMATGTGKTKTALRITKYLLEKNEIDKLIVTCYGSNLLDQWYDEILDHELTHNKLIKKVFNDNQIKNSVDKFIVSPKNSILIISIDNVSNVLKLLDDNEKNKLLVIYDEVHDIASETRKLKLLGLNKNIKYKLGLSATPDRGDYDIEGTNFIFDELESPDRKPIFQFSIENAIEREILVEFDYVPLEYSLTKEDKETKRRIIAWKTNSAKEGKKINEDEFRRKLAEVNKKSEAKLDIFKAYLKAQPEIIKSSIIFVFDKAYGEKVIDIIQTYTNNYSNYFESADISILEKFARNELDVLITCHKLSQGIDINGLKNVIIFSSDSKLLETIQRVGRCLRYDPNNINKRAKVIDFVQDGTIDGDEKSIDKKRYEWLKQVSQVKKIIND